MLTLLLCLNRACPMCGSSHRPCQKEAFSSCGESLSPGKTGLTLPYLPG